MRAMVLAAGLGTRLGALSDERPKPLLPVCDVPLIRYNLALLAAHGFREVAVNLFHLGDLFVEELRENRYGLDILFSHEEPEILGTGGGLAKIGDWLTHGGREPFVVMNGKVVLDVDLSAVIARHRDTDAAATLVVREVPDAQRWGAVDVSDAGEVLRIIGEGSPGDAAMHTMFTGVHVVSPRILARLPSSGASDSVRQGYIPALQQDERLAAFVYDRYFEEHSTPARYLDGNRKVLRGEARLRHPPGELVGIDATAAVHPRALVEAPVRIGPRARIGADAVVGPETVVGAGAVVEAGVHLHNCVVWPGARVAADAADSIVTPRGVHRVLP